MLPMGLNQCITNKSFKNKSNPNTTKSTANRRPAYTALPAGGMRVRHREFCSVVNSKTVTAGGADPVSNQRRSQDPIKLPLNPGDGRTFPWLSGIATRFEKYRFSKIVVHYLPTVSTFANGGVALCPVYDPADPPPTSRLHLLNSEGVVRGAVHNELTLTIPRSRMRRTDTLFVRETHDSLMDANELRLSDLGYVVVSLSDIDSTANLGDVFIEYEVELESPRVGPRIGKCAHFSKDAAFTTFGSGGFAHCSPFGSGVVTSDRSNHSPASTLMIEAETLLDQYVDNISSEAVDVTRFQFMEPFSGFLSYAHDGPNSGAKGASAGLAINGRSNSSSNKWVAKPGEDLADKGWGIAEWVSGAVSAANTAQELWKITAEAGDILDLSFDIGGEDFMASAAATFMDAAPELLALL
jgi:hypothetical protein